MLEPKELTSFGVGIDGHDARHRRLRGAPLPEQLKPARPRAHRDENGSPLAPGLGVAGRAKSPRDPEELFAPGAGRELARALRVRGTRRGRPSA